MTIFKKARNENMNALTETEVKKIYATAAEERQKVDKARIIDTKNSREIIVLASPEAIFCTPADDMAAFLSKIAGTGARVLYDSEKHPDNEMDIIGWYAIRYLDRKPIVR